MLSASREGWSGVLPGSRLPSGISQGSCRAGVFPLPCVLRPYLGQLSWKRGHLFQEEKCILFETITFPMRKKTVIYQTDLALAGLHLSKMKVPSKYGFLKQQQWKSCPKCSVCWRRNLKDESCLVFEVTQTRNGLCVLQEPTRVENKVLLYEGWTQMPTDTASVFRFFSPFPPQSTACPFSAYIS